MTDFVLHTLLSTPTVLVEDGLCSGACRHKTAEECTSVSHMVFPYRGVFVRHLGRDDAVAEANQVLFSGYNPTRMLITVLIVGGFGLGLGIIYGLIGRSQTA